MGAPNIVPRENPGLGFDNWPKLLKRGDLGFEMDKALQIIVSILQYLEEKLPITLASATKILADGSRYSKFL